VADTGSERRNLRLTLRLRLTLLYGLVFIAAGAGLLAVTYGLFKHNQASSEQTLAIRGIQFTLPAGATVRAFGSGGVVQRSVAPAPSSRLSTSGSVHTTTSSSGAASRSGFVTTATPPKQLLNKIKSSGQRQLRFLAARANAGLRYQQSSDASSLLEWSAIALGVVALLSIGLAWWLAGRALRPLRTMNTRAREISAESLHQRLGVDDRHDELGELATTFDALLARLESAFESQRRFAANASHELRTPITLERTLVEVALADPDASVESLRRVCERVISSTEEQERLLDALLTLARSEAGVAAGEPVDLAVVVEDALLAREPRLVGVRVESALKPALAIGDQALLERLVGNLVDNAIVHNRAESRWIRVSTFGSDGMAGMRIANSGDVIDPGHVDELFEPFRRGVGERLGSDGDGLGLGLSIVRAVAVAHGAELEARGLSEGGLEFELRFTCVAGAKRPVGGLETVTA
jgi:signal transduction histidine kinase